MKELGNVEQIISAEAIEAELSIIATMLDGMYGGRNPLMLGVLTGGFIFLSDLVRKVTFTPKVDFIRVSSYGEAESPQTHPIIHLHPTVNLVGADIIVVEDIVDTGHTLKFIMGYLSKMGPNSLTSVALINKTGRREVDIKPDYSLFEIKEGFVIGYGLDYKGKMRGLNGVWMKV